MTPIVRLVLLFVLGFGAAYTTIRLLLSTADQWTLWVILVIQVSGLSLLLFLKPKGNNRPAGNGQPKQ